MLGSATTAVDRDSNLHPAPPLLVLQPAHLRFYGFDAHLSTPSQRQRAKGSDTPAANNSRPPSVFPSTAVGSTTETLRPVGNDGSVGTVGLNASASRGTPKANALTGHGSSTLQRAGTEAQQETTGNPGLDGQYPSYHRRGKLPLAPPLLSARCQLHPVVMRDLGLRAGDPALVLALTKGWISGRTTDLAGPPSGLPANAVGGVEPEGLGSRNVSSGVATAAVGDGGQGMGFGSGGADVAGVQVEALVRGVERLGLVAHAGGGGDPRHRERAEEAGAQKHRQQLEDRQQVHPRDQERRRVAALLPDGVAQTLRCFLCTAWTNPNLTPGEAAVDGRVSVPLPSTTTSAATAAIRGLLDKSQPPTEEVAGASEIPADSSPLRAADTRAPLSDDIIVGFLRSAVDRHLLATRANTEDGIDADPLVGIIPVSALCDGDYGVATIGGSRSGRVVDALPVAGRISARVLRGSRRRHGGMAAARGEGGRVVGGVVKGPGIAARGGSPGEERAVLHPDEGQQAAVLLQQRQRQSYLPPACTSLVKRSLRHLVVCSGCEVAVPSCPNGTGTPLEGSPASAADERKVGGGSRSGQQPAKEDGTSRLRIEINGGSGDWHGSGRALTGLFGGAVCVVAPESLILVENGEGTGDGAADSDGAVPVRRHREGGGWEDELAGRWQVVSAAGMV